MQLRRILGPKLTTAVDLSLLFHVTTASHLGTAFNDADFCISSYVSFQCRHIPLNVAWLYPGIIERLGDNIRLQARSDTLSTCAG